MADPFSTDRHGARYADQPWRPFYAPSRGEWVVTSYDDALAALSHPHLSAEQALRPHHALAPATVAALSQAGPRPPSLLASHGEVHRQLRATAAAALPREDSVDFSAVVRSCAEHFAQQLSALAADGAPVDLRQVAWRYPVEVLCRLMGSDGAIAERLHHWSTLQTQLIWGELAPAAQLEALAAAQAMMQFCRGEVAARVAEVEAGTARPTLISALMGELVGLSDAERAARLQRTAGLLYGLAIAGQETTAIGLTNVVGALLSHAKWQPLAENPTQLSAYVREALRLRPSVHTVFRWPTERLELSGATFEPGQRVAISLAQANRDPTRFPEPERFELGRPSDLTFGAATHRCVGASMGTLELEAGIGVLARQFPRAALVDDSPPLLNSAFFNVLERCVVRLSAASLIEHF